MSINFIGGRISDKSYVKAIVAKDGSIVKPAWVRIVFQESDDELKDWTEDAVAERDHFELMVTEGNRGFKSLMSPKVVTGSVLRIPFFGCTKRNGFMSYDIGSPMLDKPDSDFYQAPVVFDADANATVTIKREIFHA